MTPKKLLLISYQIGIAALAVISILLLVLDYAHDLDILASPYRQIDNVIWLILTLDYAVRLGRAKNKKHFFASQCLGFVGNFARQPTLLPVPGCPGNPRPSAFTRVTPGAVDWVNRTVAFLN